MNKSEYTCELTVKSAISFLFWFSSGGLTWERAVVLWVVNAVSKDIGREYQLKGSLCDKVIVHGGISDTGVIMILLRMAEAHTLGMTKSVALRDDLRTLFDR